MSVKKRAVVSIILTLVLAISFAAPAFAAKLGDVPAMQKEGWPWQLAEDFAAAVEAKNDAKIIEYGEKIWSHFLGTTDPEKKCAEYLANGDTAQINIMYVTLRGLHPAYERTNDVTNLIRTLKAELPFAKAYKQEIASNKSDMDFAIAQIENMLAAFEVEVAVYAEVSGQGGDTSYTGAKFEPKSGVYYGEVEEYPAGTDKRSSSAIVYIEFETQDFEQRMEHAINNNKVLEGRSVLEVAWNLLYEGSSLKGVLNESGKIMKAASYLAELDCNILLRFGAEMNVWETSANASDFKAAFQFVADIMHKNAPNVAMVWSVNNVSAAGRTYEEFYPGDAYVDWVGVSLYTNKYFAGNKNTSDVDQALYGTGKYANPIQWIEKLVKIYGGKKPIMIAEGGIEVYSPVNGESLGSWADPKLRMMYEYIPILYPEVKAIYYFNTVPSGASAKNQYKLSLASNILTLYNTLTKSPYFLTKDQTESPVTYKKLGTAQVAANSITLDTYAPYFTLDNVSVSYTLAGSTKSSSTIPYRMSFDLSSKADGDYPMTIKVSAGGGVVKTLDLTVRKSGSNATVYGSGVSKPQVPETPKLTATPTASKVLVNGKEVEFDAYKIGDNNYFKLRDLAYVLNGTEKQFGVGWDGTTETITLTSKTSYSAVGGEMASKGSGTRTPTPTASRIFVDGVEKSFDAYKIGDNNYFKLRDIGILFDFDVSWDGSQNIITIDTGSSYTPD